MHLPCSSTQPNYARCLQSEDEDADLMDIRGRGDRQAPAEEKQPAPPQEEEVEGEDDSSSEEEEEDQRARRRRRR